MSKCLINMYFKAAVISYLLKHVHNVMQRNGKEWNGMMWNGIEWNEMAWNQVECNAMK